MPLKALPVFLASNRPLPEPIPHSSLQPKRVNIPYEVGASAWGREQPKKIENI